MSEDLVRVLVSTDKLSTIEYRLRTNTNDCSLSTSTRRYRLSTSTSGYRFSTSTRADKSGWVYVSAITNEFVMIEYESFRKLIIFLSVSLREHNVKKKIVMEFE